MTGADIDRMEAVKAMAGAWLVGVVAIITGFTILLGVAGLLLGAGVSVFVLVVWVAILDSGKGR